MRSLAKRGANLRAVTLDHPWQKKPALPLWRRGLIEIWYRQSPDSQPSLQGPYYGLSIVGASLAAHFVHTGASRISGAGEVK
jgi:hypothetical protein